jgi:hypothetical protein
LGHSAHAFYGLPRGLRYAEIAMVGDKAITIYDSTGLSEAPPGQRNALDAQPIKKQFQLRGVVKSGPYWWLSDRTTSRFGEEISFGGMGFRWDATIPASLEVKPQGERHESEQMHTVHCSAGHTHCSDDDLGLGSEA